MPGGSRCIAERLWGLRLPPPPEQSETHTHTRLCNTFIDVIDDDQTVSDDSGPRGRAGSEPARARAEAFADEAAYVGSLHARLGVVPGASVAGALLGALSRKTGRTREGAWGRERMGEGQGGRKGE